MLISEYFQVRARLTLRSSSGNLVWFFTTLEVENYNANDLSLTALEYHPDRNPGREEEARAKFQTINSAHEVLTDPEQRLKYDSGRMRSSTTRSYGQTRAAGERNNPWQNAGAQWAPPPKPPPPSAFKRPPPPSAGAARYSNFATPNGVPKPSFDAKKTSQGWESMRSSQPRYNPSPPKPVPKDYTPQSGREESNNARHAPPPKARPGYEEFRAGTSPRAERTNPHRAQSSNDPPRRNGFMPGTPGGDEPPAPSRSAYSTRKYPVPEPPPRSAPPLDPLRQFRDKASSPYGSRVSTPYSSRGGEKTNPFESINLNRSKSTRAPSGQAASSAPNASAFPGASDRGRSASPPRTQHQRHLSPEPGIARADSDVHLGSSPKRTFSHANRRSNPNSTPKAHRTPIVEDNTSSDGGDSDSEVNPQSFGTRSRTFAKRRAQTTARAQESQGQTGNSGGSMGSNGEQARKINLAAFRDWWSSSDVKRNILNVLASDGPNSSNSTANNGAHGGKQDEPSMYAIPTNFTLSSNTSKYPTLKRATTLPTVVEEPALQATPTCPPQNIFPSTESKASLSSDSDHWSNQAQLAGSPVHSPSGEKACRATPPGKLTAFEAAQFRLLEELVRRNSSDGSLTKPGNAKSNELSNKDSGVTHGHATLHQISRGLPETQHVRETSKLPSSNSLYSSDFARYLSSAEMGSPSKRFKQYSSSQTSSSSDGSTFQSYMKQFSNANDSCATSFSFNGLDGKTSNDAPKAAFTSASAENISTTFTPEDWHGKFEAGDYFASDKNGPKGAPRSRSDSRSRTKSPIKPSRPVTRSQVNMRSQVPNIDPEILQQTADTESQMSPGGTKFNAEEWAKTFKPQTFAFPSPGGSNRPAARTPRRTRTGSSIKTSRTAANAAMVSEDDSSDDKGLFMGKRNSQSAATPTNSHNIPSNGTDSPNAMDVDPPLEQEADPVKTHRENGFAAFRNAANEARNVPLEPSRPDWRETNGVNNTVPQTASPKPNLPPRRSADFSTSKRRTTKSADEEDFKTNFEDLKNVEPLHNPATGLHSFADLTSNLPFPSQAAKTLTIDKDVLSGKLKLPNPPRAPDAPNTMSPSEWEPFLVVFKSYMVEWNTFNTQMIMHFVARKNQVDDMRVGWLEAFGDTQLKKYTDGLREDAQVRVHWDVACGKHEDAMAKFQYVKDRIRATPLKAAGRKKVL